MNPRRGPAEIGLTAETALLRGTPGGLFAFSASKNLASLTVDVLIVVDMQEDILRGDPKYDLPAVVDRLNRLARRVRERGGRVVFIQHDGIRTPQDGFVMGSPGWEILSAIERDPADRFVRKTLHDPFFETDLPDVLEDIAPDRLLVAGWATDFCVDATVRSASARGFHVVAVTDCQTVCDRPHASAEDVRRHHHWVWANLISPHPVRLALEAEL